MSATEINATTPLWILWESGNNTQLMLEKTPKNTKVIVESKDDVDDVLMKLHDKLKYEFRNIGMTDLILLIFTKTREDNTDYYASTILTRNDNVMEKIIEFGNSIDSPWIVTLDHLGPYLMKPS